MPETSTQAHLLIEDIHDGVVVLKEAGAVLILQTSAVNFDLLSEKEQLAIIAAFAAFLNSLSFPIQIVIRSKRLDITNYLATLSEARKRQTNPQLAAMMARFQVFLNTIIRENEVLDKQFYIAIPVSYLELGLITSRQHRFQKALTILTARRDHILRQLGRIGLKAAQVGSEQLIRLFHDLYNQPLAQEVEALPVSKMVVTPPQPTPPSPTPPTPPIPPPSLDQPTAQVRTVHPATPFVVEELPDDYGAV